MAKKAVHKKEDQNKSLSVGNLENQNIENSQPMARSSKKKAVVPQKVDVVLTKGNDALTEAKPSDKNIRTSDKRRKNVTESIDKTNDYVDKRNDSADSLNDNTASAKTQGHSKSKKANSKKENLRLSETLHSNTEESKIVEKVKSEKTSTNKIVHQKPIQKTSPTIGKDISSRVADTKNASGKKAEKNIDNTAEKNNKNKKISVPEKTDNPLNQKKVQYGKRSSENQDKIRENKELNSDQTLNEATAVPKNREVRQQSKKVPYTTESHTKEKNQTDINVQIEQREDNTLNLQSRRKKKKKSRKESNHSREDAHNNDNVKQKQPIPVKHDSKKSQSERLNHATINKENLSRKSLKGGKHTVASLEAPERKSVVLHLPSKKQSKQNTQKNIQEKQTHVIKDSKESGQHTHQEKPGASFGKHKDILSENVRSVSRTPEEKSSDVIVKEVAPPKKKDQNKKHKRNEKVEKSTEIIQHQKQKVEAAQPIDRESSVVDKEMLLNENNQQVNESQITQNEKKHHYSKPYNLIPLPKPELTKKKQTVKHKIPLPLKIGNYNDIAENVINKVEHFLSVELCIPAGSSLLLAVSGGVDSIVMSDIFCVIAHRLHYDVQLCHINHKLRGRESDDDERSVKGFAKRCGLRIHSAQVHVQEYSRKNKISIETAARILRYNALDKQARSCGAEYVVTAHTADDAAETFLMNLFRGSGITGLTGIPIERPLSKKVNIIRPMISLRKDEIISYAQERGLYWREDSSNTSLLFTRNKIRLQLLPHLRELFGVNVVETIQRTASLMQGVDEVMDNILSVFLPRYVHQIEPGAYAIELIGLSTQSEFVKGEIFQSVLVQKLNQQNQSLATIKRITQLLTADVNTCVDVNGQIVAVRERDSIILTKRKKHFDYYNTITLNGELVEQEWILRLSVLHKKPKEWSNNPLVEYFDADLLPKLLQVRSWRDGDKFQPIGMKGHTTVSDFLTNNKTRAFERKKVLVLCAGAEIVWIIGKRISECFKVSDSTQDIIKAEFILRSMSDIDENEKK